MQNLKFRHALFLCIFLHIAQLANAQQNVTFSFTLANDANTSAGVFTHDGVLVKTLWSGVHYKKGTYNQYWNGTDDEGRLLAGNNYNVRILSNNIVYKWEGVLGNTSSAQCGSTVHRAFQGMYGMAFTGNKGYMAVNYNEQLPPIYTFNIANPQAKTSLLSKGGSTAFVATDGNYVYYDCMDPNDTGRTFVYALKVSDNSEVTSFTSGTAVQVLYSRTYPNAIDVAYNTNSKISGLAVQKRGNYLFVAHKNANQIDVLNKTTGAVVQTLSVNSPGGLAIDGYDALWIISGTSLLKYNVNADGTLSVLMLSLPGVVAPIAASISPDGNTIIVADGGSSQQVKAYNNFSGACLWVYGVSGGYATGPTVTNDKFYFADFDCIHTFISFAPDGSFWLGDPGNCRALHYTANRTFIERIMYLPHFYSSVVDPTNPTRAFADYLEFKIDYSKSLNPSNGSWTLVKNWGYNVTGEYDNQFYRFRYLTTLSNGHTYAFLRHNYKLAVVELPSTGGIRYTGIELPNLDYQLLQDGSLIIASQAIMGKASTWSLQTLAGFDGLNNPVWGASKTIATSPPATSNDPLYYGAGNTVITSSNVLACFDGGLPPYGSSGFHLGGIKLGDTKWMWRTANSTFRQYTGPYPSDGAYDIGNNVQYAGSFARALDRTIIWGYHGEFWKNAEVNKWTQVFDDGLFIGQFGVAGPEYTYAEAAPMMAGNAMSVSVVKDSAGNGYVYLNDEASHGGMHRWKITGLNTIAEQTVPVSLAYSVHGLLAEYFSGVDLNTCNTKTKRVDPLINLTATSLNVSSLSGNKSFSARWTGFVNPQYSETYTYYVTASNGIRLWVNDSLIIDKWDNASQIQYSGTMASIASSQYNIRVEYYNTGVNSPAISLSWASPSQAKEIIPAQNLFPAELTDTAGGLDLMQGLSFTSILKNNMYGWNKSPASEDYDNYYSKWWSASTGYNSYDKQKSPDVNIHFTQTSGTYIVSRDLGANSSVNSWQLNGLVDYNGNAENNINGNGGGGYLEVLDDTGRIITRFYPQAIYTAPYAQIGIYANQILLARDSTAKVQSVMNSPQPFSVSAVNGIVTFTYANYAPVSTTVFDSKSNWKKPKTLRLYFFGNFNNYGRNIDVKNMRFSKTTAGLSSLMATSNILAAQKSDSTVLPILSIYPNPVKNMLHVKYPSVSGRGYLEIISTDGRKLMNYELVEQSSQIELSVDFLPAGAYVILFKNNNLTKVLKFIKV